MERSHEESTGSSPFSQISTGNVNMGPGAGAYNIGDSAGSLDVRGPESEVNFCSKDRGAKVPKGGNNNRGSGAGAVSSGEGAGVRKVTDGGKVTGDNMERSTGKSTGSGAQRTRATAHQLTPIPTGNVNRGPGAGANNIGNLAGSLEVRDRGSEVNFYSKDREAKVPEGGNNNRGLDAGAENIGVGAGALKVTGGRKVSGDDMKESTGKSTGSVARRIPATAHQLPPTPTGNINRGPGAGAYNVGNAAGSSVAEGNGAKVNYGSQAGEPKVPKGGNDNSGAGAGAVNYGVRAGAEKVTGGAKVNYALGNNYWRECLRNLKNLFNRN